MKTLLLLLLSLALPALATDHYLATASTTALTIQQPATGARQITFGDTFNQIAGATISCAAAQTATISWNGTAATSTAGAELKLPGTVNASGATIWTGSNVGGGTPGPVYQIAANQNVPLSLTWFQLFTAGTGTNLTITTTGTCQITLAYAAN